MLRFGTAVEPWWASLPNTIVELAERWQLVVGNAVERGNTSLVVRCRRADGRAAILKVTPDANLTAAEAAALMAWQPTGRVPAVWHYDVARSALLLEALPTEMPLSESGRTVALDEVVSLLGGLHRSGAAVVENGVVPLAERIEFIFGYWIRRHASRGEAVTRAVPVERLQRGFELAQELAADDCEPVLLHGDLHPGNVLDGGAERGLVAIDPRPCVGDAAVDAVDWVFWPADDSPSWESRSRELAPAVGVSHERLWAWCAAFAPMIAASEIARGASPERIDALLRLAP